MTCEKNIFYCNKNNVYLIIIFIVAGGLESIAPKMVPIWRQMALEMENGVGYKEAMWNSFSSALMEDDDILLMMNTDKKTEVQELITSYCNGLEDDVIGNLKEKPM